MTFSYMKVIIWAEKTVIHLNPYISKLIRAGIKAFLNQGHMGTRLNMVTSTRILVTIETLSIRLFC